MIELGMYSNDVEYDFTIDNYNQIINVGISGLYLSFLERLNEFNGIKYDDYIDEMFQSILLINGKKIAKKDILVIDFSSIDSILKNLSFDKTSLIRKNYIDEISSNLDEEHYEMLYSHMVNIMGTEEIKLKNKEPNIEKIFDLFFEAADISIDEKISNFNLYIESLEKYRNNNPETLIFMIVDSSIFDIEIDTFLKINKLYIFDVNININKYTKNLISFSEEVQSIELENLVNRINMNWPLEIDDIDILFMLQNWFSSIVTNSVVNNKLVTSELQVLYILIRKLFNLEIKELNSLAIYNENPKLRQFINQNMV